MNKSSFIFSVFVSFFLKNIAGATLVDSNSPMLLKELPLVGSPQFFQVENIASASISKVEQSVENCPKIAAAPNIKANDVKMIIYDEQSPGSTGHTRRITVRTSFFSKDSYNFSAPAKWGSIVPFRGLLANAGFTACQTGAWFIFNGEEYSRVVVVNLLAQPKNSSIPIDLAALPPSSRALFKGSPSFTVANPYSEQVFFNGQAAVLDSNGKTIFQQGMYAFDVNKGAKQFLDIPYKQGTYWLPQEPNETTAKIAFSAHNKQMLILGSADWSVKAKMFAWEKNQYQTFQTYYWLNTDSFRLESRQWQGSELGSVKFAKAGDRILTVARDLNAQKIKVIEMDFANNKMSTIFTTSLRDNYWFHNWNGQSDQLSLRSGTFWKLIDFNIPGKVAIEELELENNQQVLSLAPNSPRGIFDSRVCSFSFNNSEKTTITFPGARACDPPQMSNSGNYFNFVSDTSSQMDSTLLFYLNPRDLNEPGPFTAKIAQRPKQMRDSNRQSIFAERGIFECTANSVKYTPLLFDDVGITWPVLPSKGFSFEELESAYTKKSNSIQALCAKPFSAAAWSKINPHLAAGKVAKGEFISTLLQWQKPGGFENKHITLLKEMMANEELFNDETMPYWLGVFHNLLISHAQVLNQIDPNILEGLFDDLEDPVFCRNSDDIQKIKPSFKDYLLDKMISSNDFANATTAVDWSFIHLFEGLWEQMPEEFADKWRDKISSRLADGVNTDKVFEGHNFRIALESLINQTLANIFGYEIMPKVLFQGIVESMGSGEYQIKPVLLSTVPFQITEVKMAKGKWKSFLKDSSVSSYGFHYYSFPATVVDSTQPGTEAFHFFETKISLQNGGKMELSFIADHGKKPDDYLVLKDRAPYKEMLTDKVLSGMVVFGENIGRELTESVSKEYIKYFCGKKVKCLQESEWTPIKTAPYFLNAIENNKIDYLVKEAHTGGTFGSLVSVATRGLVKKIVVIPENKFISGAPISQEHFYLIKPAPDSQINTDISLEEFARAVKVRNVPLIYFNTSCWSVDLAVREYQAIASPLFIEVSSTSRAEVFWNSPYSAIKNMLDGLRQGATWEKIKGLVEGMETKSSGKDDYLFPYKGDDNFNEKIVQTLESVIEIKIAQKIIR